MDARKLIHDDLRRIWDTLNESDLSSAWTFAMVCTSIAGVGASILAVTKLIVSIAVLFGFR